MEKIDLIDLIARLALALAMFFIIVFLILVPALDSFAALIQSI